MLGSLHDAEDALQEALLGAWKGFAGFEGRSSARTWLYRVCTNACLRQAGKQRVLTLAEPLDQTADLGEPVLEPLWLEPWPDDPAARYEQRESIELAFVAALQRLPGTQRAVLVMREVLQFSAAETADLLDTTVASVNSALQRARKTLGAPARPQRADVGDLAARFAAAWEAADVPALLDLLTGDATFTMPPLPAWFRGREMVGRFLAERVFETRWRLSPVRLNGQPAFACWSDGTRAAAMVLDVRDGRVAAITAFLDPALLDRLGIPEGPMSSGARAALPR
ncbi:RNA polymerase subunit sigma-70 [Actinokineospora soli]|uniref:RNA polymerase subunit sigma-70 n=1 Tax=Actinokineospora soli TaxID=1048753 RepID=A0ABW2TV92_9PSEU